MARCVYTGCERPAYAIYCHEHRRGEAHARAELIRLLYRETHYPHALHKDIPGDLWETISYPWVEDDNKVYVNARVPGDPTTMVTVDVFTLHPEGGRTCENILGGGCSHGEFYYRRPER